MMILEEIRTILQISSVEKQGFKAVTAMSPLQFQKRLRLQETRRLMRAAGRSAQARALRDRAFDA